jgi:hypothetical protein
MQASKSWHLDNLYAYSGPGLCFATSGRSLLQTKMRSVIVVVADALIHEALEMTFIHNDHVAEQIPAAVADPTLGHAVLPRTSITGPLRLDAEALHSLDHIAIEVRTAIKDQVSGFRVVGGVPRATAE